MISHYRDVKTWILFRLSKMDGESFKLKHAVLKRDAKNDLKLTKGWRKLDDTLAEMIETGEIRFNGVHYSLGTTENYQTAKKRRHLEQYGEGVGQTQRNAGPVAGEQAV